MISFLCVFNSAARADISGPDITDNNYTLDLRQGPVLGSARQVALGGAYIGVAEGMVALPANPAGVAFRPARSTTKFDWDWTLGWMNLESNDFDNNGVSPPDYIGRKIFNAGLMGQWGPWGVGFYDAGEVIQLKNSEKGEAIVLNVLSFDVGRQVMRKELTLGGGLRTTSGKVRDENTIVKLGKLFNVGWQVGALWNPEKGPFRLGFSYKSKMHSEESLDEPVKVLDLYIPEQIVMPAEWGLGASYHFPSVPFWKGHPWLLAGDVNVTEPSENAVGVESLLAQKKQPIGTERTMGYRLGTELEAWPNRLRIRMGGYYEPSNFEGVSGRTHVTGGFEVRLFHVNIWNGFDQGIAYSFDYARGYMNHIISLGFWYPFLSFKSAN